MYRALSSFSFLVSHKWSSRCCNGSLRRRGCSYYWYHLDLSNYSTKTWKKVFISSIITALSCIDQEFQKDIAMLSTGWVPWLATPQQLLRLTHEPNGQRTWDKLTTFVNRNGQRTWDKGTTLANLVDKEHWPSTCTCFWLRRSRPWRRSWTRHCTWKTSNAVNCDHSMAIGLFVAIKRPMLPFVTMLWPCRQ